MKSSASPHRAAPKKASKAHTIRRPAHTVASRSYTAKHTHFNTWKPTYKANTHAQERREKRHANRIISTEQFARARKPFDMPVITKTPIPERPLTRSQLIDQVNLEEHTRLKHLPRETVPFKIGDSIAVTALLSLTEAKTQVYKGVVIATNRGRGLFGRFTLRNNSDGGHYEISFPYWSPFLRKIEIIEDDQEPIVGKTKLQQYYRGLPEDHPKNRAL